MNYNKIKSVLAYSEETGDIYWIKDRQGHTKKGDLAGSIFSNGSGKKYRTIKVFGKHYLAHRLAWLLKTGSEPSKFIDHINGDGLDNRFFNLREVTRTENQRNQKISKRSKTGVMGVSFDKKSGKWSVRIGSRENQERLGYFSDFFEAVCVRKSAEIKRNFHKNHGSSRDL